MPTASDHIPTAQSLILEITSAARRVERRLDAELSNIVGLSFAEYRLLKSLAEAPSGRLSRVDLGAATGLTASGATRALRPLERIGVVETSSDDRDARRALAGLTAAGRRLVTDASAVVDDAAAQMVDRSPAVTRHRDVVVSALSELAG
jgi:DNA-binding MarR family transcriptional regulator